MARGKSWKKGRSFKKGNRIVRWIYPNGKKLGRKLVSAGRRSLHRAYKRRESRYRDSSVKKAYRRRSRRYS